MNLYTAYDAPCARGYPLLLGAAALAVTGSLAIPAAAQETAPQRVHLSGLVRDFDDSHPDFDMTNGGLMGHYAGNVAPMLGDDGRPIFTASGREITSQWHDKDGNPIMPYAGPGLPGGHFDVDVYDEPTTNEEYHEHEFDDKFDVTFVDVANDPKLLWDEIIGDAYPNSLNMEFLNVHNGGGGTFVFQAGGPEITGTTADGFAATFLPGQLSQLRVNFIALAALRPTKPGDSQGDVEDRDDAFTIRMYDSVSGDLVYEIAVYHHYSNHASDPEVPEGEVDACGVDIDDSAGTYGDAGTGAVSGSESFDQWYRDEVGTNQSGMHGITLERDVNGVYRYHSEEFYPIDDRLMGNDGDDHNNFFTYAITATFTYNQCTDQFFEFSSNDDAWVYVDDQLVIDLGGVNTPSRQYVAMDRLGLVDGQEYTLSFFYAHRRSTYQSLFDMRTNLPLATTGVPSVTALYD